MSSVGSLARVGPGQPAGSLFGPEAEPVRLGLFVRLSRDIGVRGQVGGGICVLR